MKRTKLDIIGDILAVIMSNNGEIKPTHLMYKSNLAHNQMKSYLEELIQKDLIKKIVKNKKECIAITEKGYHFAQKLKEIKQFERAFGF